MISAGGMKVAYRGIFRRTRRVGRWYFLERDKDPRETRPPSRKKRRSHQASREVRKPRNPLAVPYERYLAYVLLNAASRVAIVHAQDRRRLPPFHGGTIQNSVSSFMKKSQRVTQ